ncbi:MAG: LarC family nickel insertion protein [Pseudomonadota bacterium]
MSSELQASAVTAIHLDAVGGVAGDMFTASLCDGLPCLIPIMNQAIEAVRPNDVETKLEQFTDGILIGKKFVVSQSSGTARNHGGHHHHSHADDDSNGHKHHHHHRHWRDIRTMLERAELPSETRDNAISIFALLAKAEAEVHGIDVDSVAFHEVGAWDSIIDIVAAASIISQLSPCRWSMGPLPIGRGMVNSAHGMLPVPAPATVKLLNGFTTFDDGESGERITPTGAAILAFLSPSQSARAEHQSLSGSGTGHGNRRLERRSNVLRCLMFGKADASPSSDTVEVLRCEIDDQSGEDLAIALDHLRAQSDVLDVCQWPVVGKKGRLATALQLIVTQGHGDAITTSVLDQTTTLGVRRMTVARNVLKRQQHDIDGIGVKVSERPSGPTAKAEAGNVAAVQSIAERQQIRHQAEEAALEKALKNDS